MLAPNATCWELIVLGTAQGKETPYTHSGAFVRINISNDKYALAYCACDNKSVEWYPSIPPHNTGEPFSFSDTFDRFERF